MTRKKNSLINIGIVAAIVPHIFCCGMPVVLAIIGAIAPNTGRWHLIPHSWEPWIFVFSGLMLALSWAMVMDNRHCACGDHAVGTPRRVQKIILWIAGGLFVVGLVIHLVAPHQH